MSFLWKVVGFGGGIPNFPFKFDSTKADYVHNTATLRWTIREGNRLEDGLLVAIFTIPIGTDETGQSSNNARLRAFAQNALKFSRSLMLPGILRCYGGVEHDNCIYIATERCLPLSMLLSSAELRHEYYDNESGDAYEQAIALGLKNVGEALIGLARNGLLHGNVSAESLYVTPQGFWRLWGFELVSEIAVDAESVNDRANLYEELGVYCLPKHRAVDIVVKHQRAVDAWGMAGLICEIFCGNGSSNINETLTTAKDLTRCQQKLPSSLRTSFQQLLSKKGDACQSITQFIENCDFIQGSVYVSYLAQLDHYMLMDAHQQETFMEQLSSVIRKFPLRMCLMTILPKLTEVIQLGSAPVTIVSPVVAIADYVVDSEAFDQHVAPCLTLLFQSTNLAIRYSLLQSIDLYGSRLSVSALEKIWPLYARGLSSTAAAIQDSSLRGLVRISRQLKPKVLTQEVPALLQKAQDHPDGTIRCNATIAFLLISADIPNDLRTQILLPAFIRMLKDSFAPSRIAALQSLRAILPELQLEELSQVVIPRIAPLLADPLGEVRTVVLSILSTALGNFESHHRRCLEQEKVHQLQVDQEGGDCFVANSSIPTSVDAVKLHDSKRTGVQAGRCMVSPIEPLHSHLSPTEASSNCDNICFSSARDPSEKVQLGYKDTLDRWKDRPRGTGATKKVAETAANSPCDSDRDGWDEETEISLTRELACEMDSSPGSLNGVGTTPGQCSITSMAALSSTKPELSLKVALSSTQGTLSSSNCVKNNPSVPVMKLRSKKKSLGALRLN